jgi:hypothetical protein
LWPPDLCQVFAQQPDRNRTVTNRRCNAFHTAMSDVATANTPSRLVSKGNGGRGKCQ